MKASGSWLESGFDVLPESIRSGYAPLQNYTAAYQEWGDGPPLVLVPGLAGGIGLMSPLAEILARDFHVISYQLRGEDDCFVLRRRSGLNELVDDLAEFIEWHRFERPVIVGVSFGGVLALEYAARYRSRLSGLVAQGVDVRFEPTVLRQVAGRVLSGFPLPPDSPFVNQFFNLLFGGRPRSREIFEFVTRQVWLTDQGVMAHRFRLAEEFDLSERLEEITAPTLLLSGDRDLLVSDSGLTALRNGIPRSRLVRLAGAGHLAFVTHPEEMACHVRQFALQRQLVDA